MEVVIGVRILGLQGEDPRIWRRVQLDHGLHGQRSVYEVGRLVIDVLDLDDDALIVCVCKMPQGRGNQLLPLSLTKEGGKAVSCRHMVIIQ